MTADSLSVLNLHVSGRGESRSPISLLLLVDEHESGLTVQIRGVVGTACEVS